MNNKLTNKANKQMCVNFSINNKQKSKLIDGCSTGGDYKMYEIHWKL